MPSLDDVIRSSGGAASTAEFTAAGFTLPQLLWAVERGRLIRPRKGWYVGGRTDPELISAVRVGGRLTSTSVARRAGLWIPDATRLHVEVPSNASRLRSPRIRRIALADDGEVEVCVHWRGGPIREGLRNRLAAPLSSALRQVVACESEEDAFVIFESALHRGLLDTRQFELLASGLPRRRRRVSTATGLSESGTESMLRLLLDELGVPYRQQHWIPAIGRVDFLVGDRLVVEVDSREFHQDLNRDLRRHAALSAAGCRSLRFAYVHIRYERELVRSALLAAIARGDHLR